MKTSRMLVILAFAFHTFLRHSQSYNGKIRNVFKSLLIYFFSHHFANRCCQSNSWSILITVPNKIDLDRFKTARICTEWLYCIWIIQWFWLICHCVCLEIFKLFFLFFCKFCANYFSYVLFGNGNENKSTEIFYLSV